MTFSFTALTAKKRRPYNEKGKGASFFIYCTESFAKIWPHLIRRCARESAWYLSRVRHIVYQKTWHVMMFQNINDQ